MWLRIPLSSELRVAHPLPYLSIRQSCQFCLSRTSNLVLISLWVVFNFAIASSLRDGDSKPGLPFIATVILYAQKIPVPQIEITRSGLSFVFVAFTYLRALPAILLVSQLMLAAENSFRINRSAFAPISLS